MGKIYATLTIDTDHAKDLMAVLKAMDAVGLLQRVQISVPKEMHVSPFPDHLVPRIFEPNTTWGSTVVCDGTTTEEPVKPV